MNAIESGKVIAKPQPIMAVKRPQSLSPPPRKQKVFSPATTIQTAGDRRSQSLSPSTISSKRSLSESVASTRKCLSVQSSVTPQDGIIRELEVSLPRNMITKMSKTLSIKKREFLKMRNQFITQQNVLLENLSALKDLETRIGVTTEDLMGEMSLVTLKKWPIHDLLMLIKDEQPLSQGTDLSGVIGPQVIQHLTLHLNTIPNEVLSLSNELMSRRKNLLTSLSIKHRNDRTSYQKSQDLKAKNSELESETETLNALISNTVERMRSKIHSMIELAKTPWLDRELLLKKLDRAEREVLILQQKLEDIKKDAEKIRSNTPPPADGFNKPEISEDLKKEKAAREVLKETLVTTENALRLAKTRIANLERAFKEARLELEASQQKQRGLEQLYRHRESSYDARSKKLLENSKNGEITIESLSKQRDALEIRVKELREKLDFTEKHVGTREAELKARADSLQSKMSDQEKAREHSDRRIAGLEARIMELEDTIQTLKEKSSKIVELQKIHCVDIVPIKENEPSIREIELWKELQMAKKELSRAEEEQKISRAEKDRFLNSLAKIAKDGADLVDDRMASELLDKEQSICRLHNTIREYKQNEQFMKENIERYENQLAELRLEVKKLQNYNCFATDVSNQDLHTEVLELQMKVNSLTRERSALISETAGRALLLERHERAADVFARITRLRRDLNAIINNSPDGNLEGSLSQVACSLSTMCASAADTWSSLRCERARVLQLERTVLAQSLKLAREDRIRIQLETSKATLERQVQSLHAISTERLLANASTTFRDTFGIQSLTGRL